MSKPSDKSKTGKTIQHKTADYDSVLISVVELLDMARRASSRVVNTLKTATYWEIGRRIVEQKQAGQKRAGYGEEVVIKLSKDLTQRFGRGFSPAQVAAIRQFHLTLPLPENFQSVIGKSSAGSVERLSPVAQALPLPRGGDKGCRQSFAGSRKFAADDFQTLPRVGAAKRGKGIVCHRFKRLNLNPPMPGQYENPKEIF